MTWCIYGGCPESYDCYKFEVGITESVYIDFVEGKNKQKVKDKLLDIFK